MFLKIFFNRFQTIYLNSYQMNFLQFDYSFFTKLEINYIIEGYNSTSSYPPKKLLL